MEINVSQLLKEPIGSSRSVDVDTVIENADVGSCPVKGTLKLIRTNRSILVQADLVTDVTLTCSRCLSLFGCRLKLQFEEEYFPTIDIVSGQIVELPEEQDVYYIDEHHIINIVETIRDYILLATPMKPLCKVDCAGICPNCGADLNKNGCNCEIQVTGSAFNRFKRQFSMKERNKNGSIT